MAGVKGEAAVARSSGLLAEIGRIQGEGITSLSLSPANITLGQVGGSKKGSMKLELPRPEGAETMEAFMSVGVITPSTLKPPVRWRLSLDNSTISRELKPQLSVELEEGYYHKVIYDVRPLLSRKLAERRIHSLVVSYDGAHLLTVVDVAIIARFRVNDARTSSAYFSGARVMEPGEKEMVYARIGQGAPGSLRRAYAMAFIPGASSTLRLAAGGSRPVEAQGPGVRILDVEVPFKGHEVPVALVYPDPGEPIYPKRLVASDVAVIDNHVDGYDVDVKITAVNRGINESRIVRGLIRNRSGRALGKVHLEARRGDMILAQTVINSNSSETSFEIHVHRGMPNLIRVKWEYRGFPLYKDAYLQT